jgi:predicted nucleic acid-binding protein
MIKPQPNDAVLSWLQDQSEANLYLSVLTFGEIEKGIEKAPDNIRKKRLKLWLEDDLKKRFENRIIPIDMIVATRWGAIQGVAEKKGQTMPTIDGLIAVSGLVHHCVVVTRNTTDMQPSSAELFNPWV